jgi:hypothetical protein
MGAASGGILSAAAGTVASAAATTGATVASGLGEPTLPNGGPSSTFPGGLFVDGAGNVYIADYGYIEEWAPGASSPHTLNFGGDATDVFVDGAGHVYSADSPCVVQNPPAGAPIPVAGICAGAGDTGSAPNQLNKPTGIFVDSSGNVYVADTDNNRVQEWAPGATSGVTVAGGHGYGSAANQLELPSKVVVDSVGNVYVADTGNNRVQEWAPGATSGVTVAGGNGAGPAANQLSSPGSVFVDGAGDIYVADTGNNRVQEWAPGATAGVTVAGGNGAGQAADQLDSPEGLFVDGGGDVYVSDTGNGRVQEWGTEPNAAPLVTANPQNQSAPENGTATFTAAANGAPSPTVQWQQSTDGGSTWSDIAGASSTMYTITTPPGSDNGDQFEAVFTNAAGSATTSPATLTVIAPPTTSVLVPASGATLSGQKAVLDASASSTAFSRLGVYFELNGNGVNNLVIGPTTPTLYGYLAQWDSTGVANGTYTLQSVAVDGDSQSTTSTPITVTVNNPPPTTAVLVPSNVATLSGQKAVLDASASGPGHITGVQFVLSGGSLSGQVAVATGVPTLYGYVGQWDTTTVLNGTYTLQSEVTESGGTTALSPGITVTVQNAAPTTAVLVPSSGATLSGKAAVVDASASGPGHITSVQFVLSGGSLSGQVVVATGAPTLYGYLAQWDTTAVANGTYTLQSVATEVGSTTATSPGITVTVQN